MVLLGDTRQAVACAEQALAVAEKVRFRPEVALARLQRAELELDASLALAHLEPAVAALRAMNMCPGLRRGLHLLWRTQARLAQQSHTQRHAEVARSAAAAAWATVDELEPLVSDDTARQALRHAAAQGIPNY
jgi:hypothetical protein